MSRELDRCSDRCAQTELELRQGLLNLLDPSKGDPPERVDRLMSRLDDYVEARLDLREAQHADREADARDY